MKSPGQIAYEAYCISRGWKSYNGGALPSWDYQEEDLKSAWESAAQAVLEKCR
jgi:hypothetical protein